jgi:protein-tyrosine phosphatase
MIGIGAHHPPISQVFTSHAAIALSAMQQTLAKGKGVFVHCAQGRSRSVSVILAHLMSNLRMPLQQALSLVMNARPIVKPNAGFFKQLISLEKSLFGGKKTLAEEQYLTMFNLTTDQMLQMQRQHR